jgi:hypothetical protein
MTDLIKHLARTTSLSFDDVERLVNSGLMLGWTVDEMREYGGDLPTAIECAAAGFSKAQIAGWRAHLPLLLVASRSADVSPRDVPNAPPG